MLRHASWLCAHGRGGLHAGTSLRRRALCQTLGPEDGAISPGQSAVYFERDNTQCTECCVYSEYTVVHSLKGARTEPVYEANSPSHE